MITKTQFEVLYPDLDYFSSASTAGAYYYQTRRGKRVKIKKGKNRLNIYKGKKVRRLAARTGFKVKNDEYYGKAVLSSGDRSRSIKQKPGFVITAKDDYVKAAGRVNNLKGGVAVGRKRGLEQPGVKLQVASPTAFRGRKIDAIAYSREHNSAEFNADSPTYTRRTKTGKVVVVKKGKRRKKLNKALLYTGAGIAGLTLLGLASKKRSSPVLSKATRSTAPAKSAKSKTTRSTAPQTEGRTPRFKTFKDFDDFMKSGKKLIL